MPPRRNQAAPSRVNDGYAADQPKGLQQRPNQGPRGFVATQTIVGPLPSAAELERYQAIIPDMPERLLANFEKQTDHRIDLENRVIQGDIHRADLGLKAGWTFAVLLLAASVFLISTSHESVGVLGLLTEFAWLGGSFIYTDIRRRQERNRRERLNPP